jgi:hypothetical protein
VNVFLAGRRIVLDASRSLGKGGEAEVFDLGDGRALKVFKAPSHPDFGGWPIEQAAAKARIEEHQEKLRRFPRGLPPEVVVPEELATDRTGRTVLGYAMRKVASAEPLFRLADPTFRRAGFSSQEVVALFCRLHRAVVGLHLAGVVIGDFNDRNVLVVGAEGFLIDADSYQFESFRCAVFTDRFVDPLLCDPSPAGLVQARAHSPDTDWYAFAALLMQSLLFVGPYGGVYRPRSAAQRVPHGARPLQRITVFHPEVQYPKPAALPSTLPDDLLERLRRIFEKDERGAFPLPLLESLSFRRCPTCGAEHARIACPLCSPSAALRAGPPIRARGEVVCKSLFKTRGVVLHAAVERGELRYVFHDGMTFRREDGSALFAGRLDPSLRFAICARQTLVGRPGEVVALAPGLRPEKLPAEDFGSDGSRRFWIQAGRLMRDGAPTLGRAAPELVGEVLAGQTRFFLGPTFGLGLYRAGALSVAFAFEAARGGLNDQLELPPLPGQLLAVDAELDEQRAWLRIALGVKGRAIHLCLVYSRAGKLEATAEALAGDESWLGTLGGACAVGGKLLVATDAGIVRVELAGGAIAQTRTFVDTEPFVSSDCRLLAAREGLVVVRPNEIVALQMP